MDIALNVLLLVSSLIATPVAPQEGPHVRSDDAFVRATIEAGIAASPIFRDLVAQIDDSDVIVYVSTDCTMPSFLFGKTTFMSSGGGRRYVLIGIACARAERERVAILAHELRHAIEIADAPSIVDQSTLAAEYQRIGFMSDGFTPGKGFDTRAAIETGRRVWAELGRNAE
jgi:hypothetical protein